MLVAWVAGQSYHRCLCMEMLIYMMMMLIIVLFMHALNHATLINIHVLNYTT